MRKEVWSTAIMLIVILIVPMEHGVIVKGNFVVQSIEIISPQSPPNYVYNTSQVDVSVLVTTIGPYSDVKVSSALDGKPSEYLTLSPHFVGNSSYHDGDVGTVTLNTLDDGYHILRVIAYGGSNNGPVSTIFLVNATGYHTPQLLSPLNSTYTKNKVELIYTSDENKYSVYYKLDNSDYSTLTTNTTLTGLLDGTHTISIKAMNGNRVYSQQTTTYFNVNTTKSNLSVFGDNQAVMLAVASIVIAVFLIAVIVIFRRKNLSQKIAGKEIES